MSKEILNGQITSTKLGEEHGCLTAEIFLEGDGWGVHLVDIVSIIGSTILANMIHLMVMVLLSSS